MDTSLKNDERRSSILSIIQKIAREILDDPSIVLLDHETVDHVAGWDSIAHVQIMMEVEDSLGVKFTVQELSEFADLGELIDTIIERQDG